MIIYDNICISMISKKKKALYAVASRSLLDAMTHPHIEDQ